MHKLFSKLRRYNKGQYNILTFCIALSVFLITAFCLMYLGPTVQEFLPDGGDTRKMASLLLGVTIVGCTIFTVYASSLFFRYKSREYGIFLALGTPRKVLAGLLFKELSYIAFSGTIIGLILALPASFGIWKLFEYFIISTEEMSYRFGFAGLFAGIAFSVCLALILGFCGIRFVQKSDVMEILRTSQKTEMVKEIPKNAGKIGILLIILGLFLGMILPVVTATVFSYRLPGIFQLCYLLAAYGIYLFMLNIIAQSGIKKQKEKYYSNLVSISLMRFSAKSATRNMCVVTLLLFAGIFAAFFGMLYNNTGGSSPNSAESKELLMHYPSKEEQLTKEEITALADQYDIVLEDYTQIKASNLVTSFLSREFSDDGTKYITVDSKASRLSLFLSASMYEQFTGDQTEIPEGFYITVLQGEGSESFFSFRDGLYEAANPDTGITQPLQFLDIVRNNELSGISEPFLYVLSDTDYQTLTEGISDTYTEQIVGFNSDNFEASYPFAQELTERYVDHATAVSNLRSDIDLWEAKLAEEQNKDYELATVELSTDNYYLLDYWKFAPVFQVILSQNHLQMVAVYVMLSLYIFIITISACSVMNYVRSISVAVDNKTLFQNLEKLGADKTYRRDVLKKQLFKIYLYPSLIGGILGFSYAVITSFINDQQFTVSEIINLRNISLLIVMIWAINYLLYRVSKQKAEQIAGIN